MLKELKEIKAKLRQVQEEQQNSKKAIDTLKNDDWEKLSRFCRGKHVVECKYMIAFSKLDIIIQ